MCITQLAKDLIIIHGWWLKWSCNTFFNHSRMRGRERITTYIISHKTSSVRIFFSSPIFFWNQPVLTEDHLLCVSGTSSKDVDGLVTVPWKNWSPYDHMVTMHWKFCLIINVNGQRGLEINCSRSEFIQQLLHSHFSLCLIKDIGSPCQKLHMLTLCATLFKLDEGSWLFFVKTFSFQLNPES